MKAILLLALFAVTAFGAVGGTVDARFGYDTDEFSHAKSGGSAFVRATITNNMLLGFKLNGTGSLIGSFQIELYAFVTSTTSRGSNAKVVFKAGSAPSSATDGELLATKSTGNDDVTATRGLTTELLTVTDATPLVVYFGFFGDCSTCSSSADFKANLFIRNDATGGTNFIRAPFAVVDGPYTADYSQAENTNGNAAYIDITADTDIYIKVSMQTASSSSAVVIIYTMDLPYVGTTTPTSQSATVMFRPDELCPPCRTGSYTTSAVRLTVPTGKPSQRWFFTPRVGKVAVSGTKAGFDFAVGVGHVPASGAMVVPSIVTFVLASLAALFLL